MNYLVDIAWREWLAEPIYSEWYDSNGNELPRHRILHHFLTHGLFPLLEMHSYTLAAATEVVSSRIATGLFKNRTKSYLQSDWRFGLENTDFSPEDLDQFHKVLSPEVWEAFWDAWGGWSDVSSDSERGIDRRNDIQAYIWTQLDLRASGQTAVLEAEHGIGEEEKEDWGGGKRGSSSDHYIREASESNEWGGYRR